MDKKNNEGKTFADIFSTIENDSIDFNSVNKSISQKEEKKNSLENSNSIFDKKETSEPTKEISSSSIFDKVVKAESKESIFEKETDDNLISASDLFNKAIKETEDTIKEDNTNNIETNDIFNNNNTDNNKDTNNIFFDNKEETENNTNNIETNDIFSNNDTDNNKDTNNIFFDNKEETEDNTNNIETNDIFSNNDTDNNKDTNNIFFENKEEIEDNTKNVEANDIFNNNDTDNNKDTNNIFFDNKEEENNNSIENNTNQDEEAPKDNEPDNNLQIDSSPFFQNEDTNTNATGENPFFNNKINLVESNKHSTNEITGKIDVSNVQNFDVKIRKKKPSLLQSIIGVLSYALFIFLLLVGIALLVYVLDIKIRAAKGDNSPPKYGAYVVLTGSMLPEIQVYDVVITKKVDAKDLKEQDVITFASSDSRFSGTIITHRIIKKNYSSKTKSYTFQTKGDNNNVADSALVTPENIFGRVIFKIPKLGYLRDFLASRGGWIIVILLPCLAVVSYDIVKIAKGMKKKKYKNLVQSK